MRNIHRRFLHPNVRKPADVQQGKRPESINTVGVGENTCVALYVVDLVMCNEGSPNVGHFQMERNHVWTCVAKIDLIFNLDRLYIDFHMNGSRAN